MDLSKDLISQFAKIATDKKIPKKETIVYGTVVEQGGKKYVKLDGSDLLTPSSATAGTKAGDRVTVMIKNHTATVTGNLSSPSVRVGDIGDIQDAAEKIVEFETALGNKAEVNDLTAATARIDALETQNVSIKNHLDAAEANIDSLLKSIQDLNNRVVELEKRG